MASYPWFSDGKESICNAEDLGLIPGSGRSPRKGNGNPLQYSCLENSIDRGDDRLQSMVLQRVGHNWMTNTVIPHFSSPLRCQDINLSGAKRVINILFVSLGHRSNHFSVYSLASRSWWWQCAYTKFFVFFFFSFESVTNVAVSGSASRTVTRKKHWLNVRLFEEERHLSTSYLSNVRKNKERNNLWVCKDLIIFWVKMDVKVLIWVIKKHYMFLVKSEVKLFGNASKFNKSVF